MSTRFSILAICAVVFCCNAAIADPASQFATAQEELRNGEPAIALALFEELRNAHPNDVDYVFGSALSLLRLERRQEALEQLTIATQLAPDYEAVWQQKFAVLKHLSRGQELTQFSAQAAHQFPSADWWRITPSTPSNSTRVMLGAERHSLSANFPGWQQQFVLIQRARCAQQP